MFKLRDCLILFFFEGKLEVYSKLKEKEENKPDFYKFDLEIEKVKLSISKLTQNVSPGFLLRQMVEDSND